MLPEMVDHRDIDARSLAFGTRIADRLRADPALVAIATANIDRWYPTASAGVRKALDEWRVILDGPLDDVIRVLTAVDEESVRLRQSSPFAGLMTEAERLSIIREFAAHDSSAA